MFPNSVAPAIVLGPIVLGWAILDAAALGFLGIGIRPPTSEWGVMVAEGAKNIDSGEWWTWLFPGLDDPRRRARLQLDRRRSAQPLPVRMSVLTVDNLTVSFPGLRDERHQVVDGVSFEVGRPETVALVGESGSGKSVTALSIMGLLPDTARIDAGDITADGKLAMIFQSPRASLNPLVKAGDQIARVVRLRERREGQVARRSS